MRIFVSAVRTGVACACEVCSLLAIPTSFSDPDLTSCSERQGSERAGERQRRYNVNTGARGAR